MDKIFTKNPIAHRGLHSDGIPENSMPAFKAAIKNGYGIETDVRLTKDNQLVICHDDDLMRLAGGSGTVSGHTYEEISKMKLLGSDESIPLFKNLLEIAWTVPLIVEIKKANDSEPPNELEIRLLSLLKAYSGAFAVQSFNPFTVEWFRLHAPEFVRGLLISKGDINGFSESERALVTQQLSDTEKRVDYLAFDKKMRSNPIVTKLNSDIARVVWTVTSPSEAAEFNGISDNMIFERFIPSKSEKN